KLVISNNKIHDYIQGGISNNVASGIILFRALNVTISNNEIYNVVNGMYYKHTNPGSQTTLVQNNLIHDVSGRCLLWTTHDATITNNVMYNCGYFPTQFLEEAADCGSLLTQNNVFSHNTLDGAYGVDVDRGDGDCSSPEIARTTTIRDNIIYGVTDT